MIEFCRSTVERQFRDRFHKENKMKALLFRVGSKKPTDVEVSHLLDLEGLLNTKDIQHEKLPDGRCLLFAPRLPFAHFNVQAADAAGGKRVFGDAIIIDDSDVETVFDFLRWDESHLDESKDSAIETLRHRVARLSDSLANIQCQSDMMESEIEEAGEEIAAIEEELETIKDDFAKLQRRKE